MTAGAPQRRLKVFLGEDNEADIHLVRRAFRQSAIDCDLEVARNGEDALSKLTNPSLVPPDLVLLDINLPRVNGLAVLRAMRQRPDLSTTSVVILTSSDAPRDREEAASLGVRRFIRKASHLDEFLTIGTVVKEILDPERARTPMTGSHAVPVGKGRETPPLAIAGPTSPPSSAPESFVPALSPPSTKIGSGLLRQAPAKSLRPVTRVPRTRKQRLSMLLWAVPFGAAAMIAIAGFVGHGQIEGIMLNDLKNDLESRAQATSQALSVWFEMKGATAQIIAARDRIRADVEALVKEAAHKSRDELPASEAGKKLILDLDSAFSTGAFEGFALIASSGEVLLAGDPPDLRVDVGRKDLPALREALGGQLRLLHLDLMSEAASRPNVLPRQIFVAVPVLSEAGAPIAVLALRLPLAKGFARMTSSARVGASGETQVFDQWGRLLTESRFEDDLRAIGVLAPGESSLMKLEGRDPGGDLTNGFRTSVPIPARPFTRAVAKALTDKGPGVDIDGFRDYRGVKVVGAWDWIPPLELGVVFKMDVREAYAAVRHLRIAFWSVLAAVLLAGVVLTAGSAFARKLQSKGPVKQVGAYTLVEKIGEGAMGTVYRASHAMLRRPAAVKILDAWEPKAIQRFEREVQLTSQLSHPSTVSIYDFGNTEDGGFYYAMEFLEGIDLADMIQLTGTVPPARVVHILRQVCGSLAEAHAKGLVHRDIKPSNIMLTVRGGEADVVKVVDFGLARLVDTDPGLKLTKDGAIFGTPGFIPPEALCEPGVFDARSDLYALGAVAYELLAGKPPFDRKSNEYLWHCHIEIVPPPPSVRLGDALPPDLEAVVMRLLAKDPSRRPQSATELRELLDSCVGCGSWSQSDAQAWWAVRGAEAVVALKDHEPKPDGSTMREGGRAGEAASA